jgi:hypothetical protein
MDEHVFAAGALNKTETLCPIEPLDYALFLHKCTPSLVVKPQRSILGLWPATKSLQQGLRRRLFDSGRVRNEPQDTESHREPPMSVPRRKTAARLPSQFTTARAAVFFLWQQANKDAIKKLA